MFLKHPYEDSEQFNRYLDQNEENLTIKVCGYLYNECSYLQHYFGRLNKKRNLITTKATVTKSKQENEELDDILKNIF